MISQGKNLLIVESLADKKRIPAYTRDKVISLGDIAIYTSEKEVPLYEVLKSIKEKENGQKVTIELSKATPDELRNYMAQLLPEFDRDRVYPTDIKRLLNWYNILLDAGITEYAPKEEDKKETAKEDETDAKEKKDEGKKKAKTAGTSAKSTATAKKTAVPKKAASTKSAASKQPAGKTTQRTRQK
jgi:hypothetical protein